MNLPTMIEAITLPVLRLTVSTHVYNGRLGDPDYIGTVTIPSWRIVQLHPDTYYLPGTLEPQPCTRLEIEGVGERVAYHSAQEITEAMGLEWKDLTE